MTPLWSKRVKRKIR